MIITIIINIVCWFWFVDDEDEEVSGIMDPDCLDPGSITGGRGGRRSPRALSPVRGFRSPRSSSPARAASPSRQGRNCCWDTNMYGVSVSTALFTHLAVTRVLLELIFESNGSLSLLFDPADASSLTNFGCTLCTKK